MSNPADNADQTQRRALQQVTFEFSFSVGKLQTSLFKSTSPTAEKALANATLEGFGLTFGLRQFDMSVDLFLRSLTLAMVEQGKVRRPLLSSAKDDAAHTDFKLLKVRYKRVQKVSPEFMTVHEGVDQAIDVDFSTFDITVAPEPILALYDFVMTTFVPKDEVQAEQAQRKQIDQGKTEHNLEQVEKQDDVEAPKSTDKIRVRVKLTSVEGECLSLDCLLISS